MTFESLARVMDPAIWTHAARQGGGWAATVPKTQRRGPETLSSGRGRLGRCYFADKSQWRIMSITLAIDGAIVAFASDREYRIIKNINLYDAIFASMRTQGNTGETRSKHIGGYSRGKLSLMGKDPQPGRIKPGSCRDVATARPNRSLIVSYTKISLLYLQNFLSGHVTLLCNTA